MSVTFPHQLLRQEVILRAVGMSLETQQSINGTETITPTFGGHWQATCNFVIRSEAAQLAWQAFKMQMEGRNGTTFVPLRTRFGPYDRDGRPVYGCGPAGLGDAQTWEHFGFDSEPVATLALVEAAPRRATIIKAQNGNTTGLRPGQFFSIGERLYAVQHHWVDAANATNLMIWPPLRKAEAAGSVMVLDRPVCLMRMASENEGEFEMLMDRMPRVSVNFVEAEV